MLTLLLFRPEGGDVPTPDEIADAITAIPGVDLSGDSASSYRAGGWRDSDTGAGCLIDVGDPPLEHDHIHPPRAYAGWLPAGVSVQVPLVGPHWFCVEAMRVPEAILAAFPEWRALDTEDITHDAESEAGPFDWDRTRVITSWERQRAVQITGVAGLARMSRTSSVALWRYRRERRLGRETHRGHAWPDGSVLRDRATGAARSAALWLDPKRPFAAPPVELIVLKRADGAVVVPGEAVAAIPGTLAEMAGARLIDPSRAVDAIWNGTGVLPASGFVGLGDEDWVD